MLQSHSITTMNLTLNYLGKEQTRYLLFYVLIMCDLMKCATMITSNVLLHHISKNVTVKVIKAKSHHYQRIIVIRN